MHPITRIAADRCGLTANRSQVEVPGGGLGNRNPANRSRYRTVYSRSTSPGGTRPRPGIISEQLPGESAARFPARAKAVVRQFACKRAASWNAKIAVRIGMMTAEETMKSRAIARQRARRSLYIFWAAKAGVSHFELRLLGAVFAVG